MKLFPLFTISDEQAMWRVQMGDDPEAFALLLKRWEGPIQNLCTRMLGDRHRGEDLAQEAVTRLFLRRRDYIPQAKFSTCLWREALNLCYDELRKRRRRNETSIEAELDGNLRHEPLDEASPDVNLQRGEM